MTSRGENRKKVSPLLIPYLLLIMVVPPMLGVAEGDTLDSFSDGSKEILFDAPGLTNATFILPNNVKVTRATFDIEGLVEKTSMEHIFSTAEDISEGVFNGTSLDGDDIVLAEGLDLDALRGVVWSPEGNMAYLFGTDGYLVQYQNGAFEEIATGIHNDLTQGDWVGEHIRLISSTYEGSTVTGYVYSLDRDGNIALDATKVFPHDYAGTMSDIALRSDGTGILVGSQASTSGGQWHDMLFKYTPGSLVLQKERQNDGSIHDAVWIDDNIAYVVGKTYDCYLRILKYNWEKGTLNELLQTGKAGFPKMALHPSKKTFLTTGHVSDRWGSNGEVYEYDIESGEAKKLYTPNCYLRDIEWDPNGETAVLVGEYCAFEFDNASRTFSSIETINHLDLYGVSFKDIPDGSISAIIVGIGSTGLDGVVISYPDLVHLTEQKEKGTYICPLLGTPSKTYHLNISMDATQTVDHAVGLSVSREGQSGWQEIETGLTYERAGKIQYKLLLETRAIGTTPRVHEVRVRMNATAYPEDIFISLGDDTTLFHQTGPLLGSRTVSNFEEELAEYLSFYRGQGTDVEVRMVISGSGGGKVKVTNLTIEYDLIENLPPVLKAIPPDDIVLEVGQVQNLSAEATDPEGQPLEVQWFIDGDPGPDGVWGYTYNSSGKPLGEHTVRISVTDGVWTVSHLWRITIVEAPPEPPPPEPPPEPEPSFSYDSPFCILGIVISAILMTICILFIYWIKRTH